MSKDPDLERDLERLMSRIELPEQERWVPTTARRGLQKPPWALAAAAAAAVIALAVGVASQSASDNAASRSPLISPPLLSSRPAPSPSSNGSVPPRGTGFIGVAGTILDFTEDAGSFAADDRALAAVVSDATSTRIVVTEVGRQKHVVMPTRGRTPFLHSFGALRGDLVAYTETEITDANSVPQKLVWHVMVANWRTGAVTELDSFPGESSIAPHEPDYMPNPYTNGRDVVWLRTPRVNGTVGGSELVLWRDGRSNVVFGGQVSYALADDGRIAIAGQICGSRGNDAGTCPGGSRWALSLLENGSARRIATRDGYGGPPAFAGISIVWPRVSTAPIKVTSVDIIDAQTGDTRTVTEEDCAWIGSTIREVVFSCADSVFRMERVTGNPSVVWSNEAGSHYFVAAPHAIIGRRVDNSWVIKPVPD
jgi:hypothetical protein